MRAELLGKIARLARLGLIVYGLTSLAWAQGGNTGYGGTATNTGPGVMDTAESGVLGLVDRIGGPLVLIGIVLVIIAIIAAVLLLRKGDGQFNEMLGEPEPTSSRYEQILAEIQGLRLRLQGGESPGYYRKVEVLGRLFLERNGIPNARGLSEDEVRTILNGGHLPPAQAQALQSILDRCRRGVEHENEKFDYTADDLLRDLYQLIRQMDGGEPRLRRSEA